MPDLCFSEVLINEMHFLFDNSVYVESRQLVRSYKLWKVFFFSYNVNSIELDWIFGNKAYGVDAEIWTQATLVKGECSHHCATFALQKTITSKKRITSIENVKNNKSIKRHCVTGVCGVYLVAVLWLLLCSGVCRVRRDLISSDDRAATGKSKKQ